MQSDFMAELIGTMTLILLGDGVVANVLLKNTKGNNSGWIVITAGWGFAVTVSVYLCGWVDGAHINPAVTVGFWAAGKLSFLEAIPYLAGQFLGAFLGAVLVYLAYLPHYHATKDGDLKLMTFCTTPAIRAYGWNFLCEVIGSATLVAGIMGIANKHNGVADGVGPIAVGLLVFSVGLSLGGPTGYAINSARDLGPRVAHAVLPIPNRRDSDWRYAWVPLFGPLLGGAIGALLYEYVFLPCWKC